ncbi:uncharacterized protein CDAR_104841 [Caerostris darwini]|uniref:Uncharacterized protein n=1 Tax=Caerostris darwini TaxID=1538125 RepID=A0AAV4W2F7_9ARAC|nr:uncharacterized protein CDAR_104841 [Caerostris darwini]
MARNHVAQKGRDYSVYDVHHHWQTPLSVTQRISWIKLRPMPDDIIQSIISSLSELTISLGELEVVECDDTVTITGWKKIDDRHTIFRPENHVERLSQWRMCLLYFNELPFRHIFKQIECQTAGHKSFSGPIGQQFRLGKIFLAWKNSRLSIMNP